VPVMTLGPALGFTKFHNSQAELFCNSAAQFLAPVYSIIGFF